MGRSPCCEPDLDVKKGPWTTEEDNMLVDYIEKNGPGNWRQLPKRAGLNRWGKSCRLRWTNYLHPDIKRGMFSEEERLIIHFHSVLGNKWSQIAARLPGRTDNEIKNYWNTHLRKKLLRNGIDPVTHRRRTDLNPLANLPDLVAAAANLNIFAPIPLGGAIQLQKLQLVHALIQLITINSSSPDMDALSLLGLPFAFQNMNKPSSDFNNTDLQALLGSLNYDYCNSSEFGNESSVGATPSTSNTTNINSSFTLAPPINDMLSLVPNSRENFSVNQTQDVVSRSSPFESRSGVSLGDLNIEFGWKDILKQISCSNRLEQEMEILKK